MLIYITTVVYWPYLLPGIQTVSEEICSSRTIQIPTTKIWRENIKHFLTNWNMPLLTQFLIFSQPLPLRCSEIKIHIRLKLVTIQKGNRLTFTDSEVQRQTSFHAQQHKSQMPLHTPSCRFTLHPDFLHKIFFQPALLYKL